MRFFNFFRPLPVLLLLTLPTTAAGDTVTAQESPSTTADTPAAVFVVRHAEKETGPEVGRDPNLNGAGIRRTGDLVELLDGAEIDAIYVTQWRRTRQTAAPLAERLGKMPTVLETTEGFEHALAERLFAEHAGDVVVVVGHSNTNPALIAALGVEEPLAISDDDYDDVYLIVFPGPGQARLTRLGYGQPTP